MEIAKRVTDFSSLLPSNVGCWWIIRVIDRLFGKIYGRFSIIQNYFYNTQVIGCQNGLIFFLFSGGVLYGDEICLSWDLIRRQIVGQGDHDQVWLSVCAQGSKDKARNVHTAKIWSFQIISYMLCFALLGLDL